MILVDGIGCVGGIAMDIGAAHHERVPLRKTATR
jgi:hypothetical protein